MRLFLFVLCFAIIPLGILMTMDSVNGTNTRIAEEIELVESILTEAEESFSATTQLELALWERDLYEKLSEEAGLTIIKIEIVPHYFDSDEETDFVVIDLKLFGYNKYEEQFILPLESEEEQQRGWDDGKNTICLG